MREGIERAKEMLRATVRADAQPARSACARHAHSPPLPSCNRPTPAHHHLALSLSLALSQVSVGHSVLVGREYQNFGDFHSVTLKPGGDTARFTQPLALTKLALFIADALREGIASLRHAPSKPLLIACPTLDESPPAFLIVAVLGSARCWRAGGRNSFGHAFARAAERTQAHMAHDGFDSAVCKVAAADHERFHEHVVLELGQL